jgi:1,4-alpha-glucan branching enzyme
VIWRAFRVIAWPFVCAVLLRRVAIRDLLWPNTTISRDSTPIPLVVAYDKRFARNWGYDGVYSFSAHHAYGGPAGLKRLVNACHEAGLAVILDVVYNHLGPEGNYLSRFGPHFTDKYRTHWRSALNFDDACSDGVRNYFIENALHWFDNYHIDGLRLDAIHAICDMSARPFLQELAERVMEFSIQRIHLISLLPPRRAWLFCSQL